MLRRSEQAEKLRNILPDELIVEQKIMAIIDAYELGHPIDDATTRAKTLGRKFHAFREFTNALRSGVSPDGERLDEDTHVRMLDALSDVLAHIP